ncbi:MAG: hypothetical protein JNL57_06575 [Bacteroidetes bacterium]|nr:hypothetical protein [Bacteroidota bacterium]
MNMKVQMWISGVIQICLLLYSLISLYIAEMQGFLISIVCLGLLQIRYAIQCGYKPGLRPMKWYSVYIILFVVCALVPFYGWMADLVSSYIVAIIVIVRLFIGLKNYDAQLAADTEEETIRE